VLRDAEYHSITQKVMGARFGPYLAAYQDVLGAKRNSKERATLTLALSFFTWRSLTRDAGLKPAAAVAAMAHAVESAKG
jgi:hypothetical protein